MSFPKGFLWGGATAANQYEGGYLDGGTGDFSRRKIPSGTCRRYIRATAKISTESKRHRKDAVFSVLPKHSSI